MLLDERDDFPGLSDDLVDTFAVAELAQDRRRPEEDVDPVDARLHGDARVVHMAANVGEDLRLQGKRRDRLAVLEGLGRRDG